MSALQITAIALCFTIPLIGWALLFRQVFRFAALYRSGQADPTRTNQPGSRTTTLLKEFFGHTRMSRLPVVAIAHWFTAISFFLLFATLVNAFFQLIWADYRLPIIGHFAPFEWLIELFAWAGFVGILVLILVRQRNHPRSAAGEEGRRSRFFGSTWWQAYYVEFTILAVTICIITLRTLEARLLQIIEPETSTALHFPLTGWLAGIWSGLSEDAVRNWIYVVAAVKILVSFAWMITIALTPTMGVAWHRFLAFPNIWFKREASGRTALGAVRPLTVDGRPFDLEMMEDLDEGAALGAGAIENFTWKGLLDFSTCTECGRCQSQCPAWNTDKPLSPKLVMMTLRDHANAKAPWLLASSEAARAEVPESVRSLTEVSLVGATGYAADAPLAAYDPLGASGAVIDEDVLWSCTTCGACVEQCPVDIEHVDHIVDMRRYRTLIESAFPSELGGLFKKLETKGNPWGMAPKDRLDWAKGLPFDVKVLGRDIESATEVEWLFWVGCAGAYEDRAKKTTRSVAELLDLAGVSFAVLGDGETCTGDSARRAGNEVLFQTLAQQNVETMSEFGVTKVVVTCAHCFNTIKNEYGPLGGSFEVVHHTQLLNRLVRDKRLVPVARPADVPGMSSARDAASTGSSVTYHDPCYLGRHNHVYTPPRELIGALPGVELREMERHGEKSFCCGAGGARMWMEEKLGTRINMNRTEEALGTGAERIAIGCPFCRVMISDGLTAKQAEGVGNEVEVVDVAQMLLAAVKRAAPETESVPEEVPAVVAEPSPVAEPVAAVEPAVAPAAAPSATAAAAPAVEADPWDDPAPSAPAAPAPAAPAPAAAAPAVEADPWDDPAPAAPSAAAAAAPAVEADPWDDPAPSAPAAPAPAAPAPAAAAPAVEADPWDDPAPAAPSAAAAAAPAVEADPWDDPAPSAPAAPAPAAPAPAAAAPAVEADPWDDPAPAAPSAAAAAAPAVEADPWDDPAPSAPAAPAPAAPAPAAAAPAVEADPWDDPAPAAPSAAAAAAPAVEADPWDDPAPAAPSAPAAPAPAAAAPAVEADPWDDPTPTAPAPEAPAPETPVADVADKDPWD